jgi:hypothetical protein
MSDHAWVLENMAAFVAGGLEPAEAERLEQHTAACPACAEALRQDRALDGDLAGLFAASRPAPALEDRLIRSLRQMTSPKVARTRWPKGLAWGAAAAVGLTVTGAEASRVIDGRVLLFPSGAGESGPVAWNNLKGIPSSFSGQMNLESSTAGSSVTDTSLSMRDPEAMAQEVGQRAAAGLSDGTSNMVTVRKKSSGTSGEPWRDSAYKATEIEDDISPPPPPQDSPPTDKGYIKPSDLFAALQPPAEPGPDKTRSGKPVAEPPKPPVKPPSDSAAPPAAPRKVVIRSGEMDFEVASFDAAVAAVTRLVAGTRGGYVDTVNSEKLANGKVRGSVVVRVPPEQLDALVLDLRKELGKAGELKGQRIASEDITKKYTDLESRLRAARTMEERLLQIIKGGKGEIKDLVAAEKELGVWRTKIEELEGEIRYYANLAALSTLTITLAERDLQAAAGVQESERVQMGIEVDDVEKAQREALAAVAEAKGRVTKSELKQQSAGQFSAVLHVEVAPEAAGTLRDRLKQLGTTARLEIDRVQRPEQGASLPRDGRVKRGDTLLLVSLYNLVNVAPRETATVQLAVPDVPAGYQALREAVARAKGRVLTAQLDEQDRRNVKGRLDFEVRRGEEGAVREALAAAGEVLSRSVVRAAEGENVTDAKVLFRTTLVNLAAVPPRETTTLGVEVADVDAAAELFAVQVAQAGGRTVEAQLAHERSGRVTGRLIYDVPLAAAPALAEKVKAAGTVRVQQASRNLQAPEGKLAVARLDVTLSNAELIVPRDDGLWPQVRKGLSFSVTALSVSASWLIVGLCVVLPWGLIGYGGYRLVRRLGRPAEGPAAPPPAG